MSDRVSLTLDEHLACLELTRVEAANAIDAEMVTALADAIEELERHDSVRALLICAQGRVFSVGGDLNYFASRLDRLAGEFDALIPPYHDTLARLAELPFPVVCAVQGAVAGGALGLLWCADVVLVADDAKLVSAFAPLGVSGDGGGTWWLPRLIGITRARELLLSDRMLSGAEAAEWGLATRAVQPARLREEALATARELALRPTAAFAEIRRLLTRSGTLDLRAGLDAERAAMVRCGQTAEARAAIAAFVEARATDSSPAR
jgi:2-(1,2-epoxy-1,2-dihydrophenyl)acetyl-CoA isomerase